MLYLPAERPDLVRLREEWRARGLKVVWTHGCFDLMHVGHLNSLQESLRYGDLLLVGVNSDASVKLIKGDARPVIPGCDRAKIISRIQGVRATLLFDEMTADVVLSELKPDVVVKGGEYGNIPERGTVEGYGGRIVLIPRLSNTSTTQIIEKIRATPATRLPSARAPHRASRT